MWNKHQITQYYNIIIDIKHFYKIVINLSIYFIV